MEHLFWYFTHVLTVLLNGTHCTGPNTGLRSNSNTYPENGEGKLFTAKNFLKRLINDMRVRRRYTWGFLLDVFGNCGVIGISKMDFSIYPVLEWLI